jgi:ATP-binding cassette subfamily C protein LapB
MSICHDPIDLAWLTRCCIGMHVGLTKPARGNLHARRESESAPTTGASSTISAATDTDASRDCIGKLLATMGQPNVEWHSSPQPAALPMVALLPEMGCFILYATTTDGQWLFNTPTGRRQLAQLPAGACFAALGAPAATPEYGSAFALFRQVLLSHKIFYLQAALATILANFLALASSMFSMQVYDRVMPTQGLSTLLVLTTGVLLAALLELLIKMVRSRILDAAIQSMDLTLSHSIFMRLLRIRMDQFPASAGTLSAQLRSYELIRSFASSATLYLIVDAPFALFFLGVIVMLAGPEVAMVPVVFFIVALAIGLFYRRRIAHHATVGSTVSNRKLGLLVETVEAAESIKAAGSGWHLLSRWNRMNQQSVEADVKIRHYSEQATHLALSVQQMSYVLLVAVGAYVAITNHLSTGGLVACSMLAGRVLAPAAALPGLIVQWAHARSALDNLEKVFALQRDNHDIPHPLAPEKIRGQFEISHLRFTYPGRPNTLAIEQLQIHAGEKIAIIGAIGAGKSTLLKLLAGLYAPQQGSVLLDGLALQQIARAHLSEHLGYLGQEVRLLGGTLRENLLAGLPPITEQQLIAACEETGLASAVAAHPKGLDLEIAEGGTGVSGGQKQLIALTRLLLSNPSVWLLDEPTAAMDDATEQRSLLALRRAMRPDATLIVITHKPVLLGLVDRLIVLTPGGVAMDGPRDAVLAKLQQNTQRLQVVKPGAVEPKPQPVVETQS